MNTNRTLDRNHGTSSKRGPQGRRLCRWCSVEVPKGRRTFCSDACVDLFRVRRDPGYARAKVFERDKGVCSRCWRDTEGLRMRLALALGCSVGNRRGCVKIRHRYGRGEPQEATELRRALADEGFPCVSRSWWEADHIVPVVEGGGACGIENLRTLCVPCHKQATARLAAKRAQARRVNQTPEQFRLL